MPPQGGLRLTALLATTHLGYVRPETIPGDLRASNPKVAVLAKFLGTPGWAGPIEQAAAYVVPRAGSLTSGFGVPKVSSGLIAAIPATMCEPSTIGFYEKDEAAVQGFVGCHTLAG
jgi:hypothetical protein